MDISGELSRALAITSDGEAASDSVDEQVKLEIAEVVLPMYNGLVVDVPKSVGNAASSKCVCAVVCASDAALLTLTPLAFFSSRAESGERSRSAAPCLCMAKYRSSRTPSLFTR
jgi:hypothetical protein